MDTKSQRILNIYETGVSETELTETLKTKINASAGGSLGSIKPTDAAPTPAMNGNYTFSIGGNKPAWLTSEAGVTTVKAGDGVAVVYTAPSSYTYTHVDINSQTLQKVAQTLSTSEQLQVLKNIGAGILSSRPYFNSGSFDALLAGEVEALKILKDIRIEYSLDNGKNDLWAIRSLTKNHVSPFENIIEIKNITANFIANKKFTTTEIDEKYSEIILNSAFGDYSGTKIKIWFDYDLTSTSGLIVSSANESHILLKPFTSNIDLFSLNTRTDTLETKTESLSEIQSTELTGVPESVQGFYQQLSGTWTPYSGYLTKKYDISSLDSTKLYASASKINGTGTALAVYFSSSNTYLGREFVGTTVNVAYSRQKLTPLSGTQYIAICNMSSTVYGTLETGVEEIINVAEVKADLYSINHWKNKKIVFLGTSVLFGANANKSYAQEAANRLGFELVNTGVPGLAIHAQDDGSGGLTQLTYGSSVLSIAEYAAIGVTIATDPVTPYIPGGSYNNHYRSWENIFKTANQDGDLYVYAVAPNNVDFGATDWADFDKNTWSYNTGTFEDHRTTFLGALIFLLNKMYEFNPQARAVFVLDSGFAYSSGKSDFETFAAEFSIPIIDLYAKWNLNPITKQYLWSVGGTNSHPSSFTHEIMGKIITNEILSIA